MKNSDLKAISEMCIQAMLKQEAFIQITKGTDNPQVLEMRHRAQGQLSGLRDMYDAIHGDRIGLRIAATGRIDA